MVAVGRALPRMRGQTTADALHSLSLLEHRPGPPPAPLLPRAAAAAAAAAAAEEEAAPAAELGPAPPRSLLQLQRDALQRRARLRRASKGEAAEAAAAAPAGAWLEDAASLEALARRVSAAQAQRASAAALRAHAARVVAALRAAAAGGRGAAAVPASPSPPHQLSTAGLRPDADVEELSQEQLAELFLTGRRPAFDGGAPGGGAAAGGEASEEGGGLSRGRGRRILRLGRLAAVASVNRRTGKLHIRPHYEGADVFGAQRAQRPGGAAASAAAPAPPPDSELHSSAGINGDHEEGAHEKEEEEALEAEEGAMVAQLLGEADGPGAPPLDPGGGPAPRFQAPPPPAAQLSSAPAGGGGAFPLPASWGGAPPATLDDLAAHAARLAPTLTLGAAARIVRALGQLRHVHLALLAAMESRFESSLGAATAGQLHAWLWYCAVAAAPPAPALCAAAAARVVALAPATASAHDAHGAATALWALCAFGQLPARAFAAAAAGVEAAAARHAFRLDPVALCQLHQVAMIMEITSGVPRARLLPPALLAPAAAAWAALPAGHAGPSGVQRQVAEALARLGAACTLEYAEPGLPAVIDIAGALRTGVHI
jgi:hypothetical protein